MEMERATSRRSASLAPACDGPGETRRGADDATTTTIPRIPDWMRRKGDGQGTAERTATREEFARVFDKAEGIWGKGNVVPLKLKNLAIMAGHLSWVDAALDECRAILQGGATVRWNLLTTIIERFRDEGGPDPPPAEPEPFIPEPTWPTAREQAEAEARERQARREAETRRRREHRAAWDALPGDERNRRIEAVREELAWARTNPKLAEAMAYLRFAEAQPQPPEVPSGETL